MENKMINELLIVATIAGFFGSLISWDCAIISAIAAVFFRISLGTKRKNHDPKK